jgi:hypothetical protein
MPDNYLGKDDIDSFENCCVEGFLRHLNPGTKNGGHFCPPFNVSSATTIF